MLLEILVKYVHFICIFAIVGSLAGEHLLLKDVMSRREIYRLSVLDAVYGISAVLLVAAGLTLWLGGLYKPAAYYSRNWIFHLKFGLFVVLGLLSVYPSIFFLRQRKGEPTEKVPVPAAVKWLVRLEFLILLIMPFLATLMARGIGGF